MSIELIRALSVVALVALGISVAVFTAFVVKKICKEKTFVKLKNKKFWGLLVPLFVINWGLQFVGLYDNGLPWTSNVFYAASLTVQVFTFELQPTEVAPLLAESAIYRVAYNTSVVLVLAALALVVVVVFFTVLDKKIRERKSFREDAYLLVGDAEFVEPFLKNILADGKDRGVLVFLKGEPQDLENYDGGNVVLEDANELSKYLIAMLKKADVKRTVYFAGLYKNDDENLRLASNLTDLINLYQNENVTVQAAFRCDLKHNYVARQEAVKIGGNSIAFFQAGVLLANAFALEHPIAKDLPVGLIDVEEGVLKKDANVCQVFVGMGETNYHVFKNSLVSDLFVGHTYKAIVYDLRDKEETLDVISRGTHGIFEKADVEDTVAPMDDAFDITVKKTDVHGESFLREIMQDVSAHDFVRVIVNLGDVALNISVGVAIQRRLRHEGLSDKCVLCVGVGKELYDAQKVLLSSNEDDAPIVAIGEESSVLTPERVWNEELDVLAKCMNRAYMSEMMSEKEIERELEKSWRAMNSFTQNSNRSVAYNLRNKMNMLGFDIVQGEFDESAFDKFQAVYEKGNARDNLARLEHLRWNAYHLADGWRPMKKKEIRVEKGRIVIKDMRLKKHACLTSVEGLEELRKYGIEFGKKNNLSESAIASLDTYRYDFVMMDNLRDILKGAGYTVVEK